MAENQCIIGSVPQVLFSTDTPTPSLCNSKVGSLRGLKSGTQPLSILKLPISLSSAFNQSSLHFRRTMSDHEITGNLRDRFIQGVVLLFLLDPVRGEPTVYSLDKDSSAVEHPRELLLKRKFLDSFALICAVRKDAKTVSAACLEEHQGEGTVVRIASNAGVCENTTNSLRHIVALLKLIAVRGKFLSYSSRAETNTVIFKSLIPPKEKGLCYSPSSNLTLQRFEST